MRTETITIYSYSELSEEAKATAYKAWEPDYAFEADNRRTLEAFCTAFGIEVTEYVYNSYCHSFRWRAKNEGDEEITDNEYIRHRLSLFEPTGFYLDDVILGPAKQPTEGKVFGNVIEECLEAFFSACCEDVKYTSYDQAQKGFAWLWDKYRTPRGPSAKITPSRIRRRRRWSGQRCTGPGSPSTASTEPETTGMNLFTNLSRRSATYNILSPSANSKEHEHKILFRGCE